MVPYKSHIKGWIGSWNWEQVDCRFESHQHTEGNLGSETKESIKMQVEKRQEVSPKLTNIRVCEEESA